MHNFSHLFDKVHVSDRSTVHYQEYLNTVYRMELHPDQASRQPAELAWQIPIACIQCWDTPDDGQWTCLKHVEYFI